jgi:hypothetical protein
MKYIKLFENWLNEEDKELALTGDYQSKKFITNFYEMIHYWKIPLPGSLSEDAFKVAIEFLNDLKSRGEAIESEIKGMAGIAENKGKTISQILKDTPDDQKENVFKHYVNYYSNNISCYKFYAFMWKGSNPQAPIIINHLSNNFKNIKHNSKVPTSAYTSFLFNTPFYNTKRRLNLFTIFNPDMSSAEFRNIMISGIGLYATLMFFSGLATDSLDYYKTSKEKSQMIRESYNFLISFHQRGWYDITGDLQQIEDVKSESGNNSEAVYPEDWLYNLFTSNNEELNNKFRSEYFESLRDYSINYYKTAQLDVVTKYLMDLEFLTHSDIYEFIKAGSSIVPALASTTIQSNIVTGEIITDKIPQMPT